MRKLLMPIIAVAMLAVGCTKENESANQTPETRSGAVQEPLTFSDATLSFASMDEMDAAVIEAIGMTAEEREQWYSANPEFVSMEKAGGMIIEQMREAGTKEAILEMRKSYTDLFIFDPNTVDVRVAPLFKTSKPGYHLVCNAYGDVTIGGSVVNFNDVTNFEQTWIGKGQKEMLATRAGAPRISNYLQLVSNSGNQRCTVNALSSLKDTHPGLSTLFLRVTTESGYNGMWYPNVDTYTISYASGITKNYNIYLFDAKFGFDKLLSAGTSLTRNTPNPNYTEEIIIGYFISTSGCNTGYNIASKWTYKNANLEISM